MKVVHLSQTDGGAGAGRAAYRIHRSLLDRDVNSLMIVADKRTKDETVHLAKSGRVGQFRMQLDSYREAKLSRKIGKNPSVFYSPAKYGAYSPAKDVRVQSADVICLYWINGGYILPEKLHSLSQPIIWRLSDVWAFSGGCHYSGGCERFMDMCGNCPQLMEAKANDVSRKLWQRKQRAWKSLNLTIAAPSQWIAGLARKSSLFQNKRIEVISTGVDIEKYKPVNRERARSKFGIPEGKMTILFGAMDPSGDKRKGFDLLRSALEILSKTQFKEDLLPVILGNAPQAMIEALPLPAISLGYLSDDQSLTQAYSAVDAVVVSSLEDNLPNVALEAIACGTPVIAFNVGGMSDVISHGENGYLVELVNAESLARGIEWIFADKIRQQYLRENSRLIAEKKFSLAKQTTEYIKLYKDVIYHQRQQRKSFI